MRVLSRKLPGQATFGHLFRPDDVGVVCGLQGGECADFQAEVEAEEGGGAEK